MSDHQDATPSKNYLESVPLEIMAHIVLMLEPEDAKALRVASQHAENAWHPFMNRVWRHRTLLDAFHLKVKIKNPLGNRHRISRPLLFKELLDERGVAALELSKLLYSSPRLTDVQLLKAWKLLKTLCWLRITHCTGVAAQYGVCVFPNDVNFFIPTTQEDGDEPRRPFTWSMYDEDREQTQIEMTYWLGEFCHLGRPLPRDE